MEKRAWVNIKMMLADSAGVKRVKKQPIPITGDQLAKMMGM